MMFCKRKHVPLSKLDLGGFNLPQEKDFVPNIQRILKGVPLRTPVFLSLLGVLMMMCHALSWLQEFSWVKQMMENEATNPWLLSLVVDAPYIIGMPMIFLASIKLKEHHETQGNDIENEEYFSRLYKNLDQYSFSLLEKMSISSDYQEHTKNDIQYCLMHQQKSNLKRKGT